MHSPVEDLGEEKGLSLEVTSEAKERLETRAKFRLGRKMVLKRRYVSFSVCEMSSDVDGSNGREAVW